MCLLGVFAGNWVEMVLRMDRIEVGRLLKSWLGEFRTRALNQGSDGDWGLFGVWKEERRVRPTCLVLVSARMVAPAAKRERKRSGNRDL